MTHLELVFYRLYPESLRITAKHEVTQSYDYLCKNDDDANDLLAHLKQDGFECEVTRLFTEYQQ